MDEIKCRETCKIVSRKIASRSVRISGTLDSTLSPNSCFMLCHLLVTHGLSGVSSPIPNAFTPSFTTEITISK